MNIRRGSASIPIDSRRIAAERDRVMDDKWKTLFEIKEDTGSGSRGAVLTLSRVQRYEKGQPGEEIILSLDDGSGEFVGIPLEYDNIKRLVTALANLLVKGGN